MKTKLFPKSKTYSAVLIGFLIFIILFFSFLLSRYLMQKAAFQKYNEKIKKENTIKDAITISDYKVSDPSLIQRTYPTGWPRVGGQQHGATQITIETDVFVPQDGIYAIEGSFNHTAMLSSIDGIQNDTYKTVMNLKKGLHKTKFVYVQDFCLERGANGKLYEDDSPQARDITVRIRIDQYGIPKDFQYNSRPLRQSDFYLHCQDRFN